MTDFLPDLPSVTLVAITSVALEATLDALQASMREARFGRVLMLTDQPRPARADERIDWRPIPRLASRSDFSRFMLQGLAGHIETSHALCVQWDGFVLDGEKWNPQFLDFDYIGAPWPHFHDAHNVGNGGFSLRSRRLLEACANLPFDGIEAEDLVISRRFRPALEGLGIRFAPESLARQFAYERAAPTGREFGFHGAFNLVRYLSAREALDLYRNLEPQILARNERWEILRWAIMHGRPKLALTLLKRLMPKPEPQA